jgi:hypothetical protein
MSKIQPLGDIMHELEDVISKMIEQHDLQHGEVLSLVNGYLDVHYPDSKEEYTAGGHPVFYYGPKKGLVRR